MKSYFTQLKNRAVQQGFISDTEWDECVWLQERCRKLGLQLPLSQVLIEFKGSDSEHRQEFLDIFLREMEPYTFLLEIDPLSVSIGSDWFLIDKAIETGAIQLENLQICNEIVKDLESKGIGLTLAEVFALKGLIPDSLLEESTRCPTSIPHLSAEERKKLVSMESLCQREHDGQLIPPILTIDELTLRIIPLSVVKETLALKQQIKEKWDLSLTFAQILAKRYLIDLSLLHLLFFSQIIITRNSVALYLGKIPVGDFTVSQQQIIEELQIGKEEARQFLAWTYRMAWLTFTEEEEKKLISALEKRLGSKTIINAQNIQSFLENKGLALSLIKVLALKDLNMDILMDVVSSEIIRGTQSHEEAKQVAEVTSPIKEAQISIPPLKQVPEGHPPPRKLFILQNIEDSELSKILIKYGVINEERLSSLLLAFEDLKARGSHIYLSELLIQRKIIAEEELYEFINKARSYSEESNTAPKKRPSKTDLNLAGLISDYKILSPPELQKSLHLQTTLCQAGISKPLEEILVQCRFLSPGMAHDLIYECQRRQKKVLEAQIAENKPRLKTNQTQIFELKIDEALHPKKIKPQGKQIHPKTSRISRQNLARRTLKRQVISSLMFVVSLLFIFTVTLAALKTQIISKKSNPDQLETISPPQTTPTKTTVTKNTTDYKETYETEMKRKGYEQWGSWWVTSKEKSILEKTWNPSQKRQVSLTLDIKNTHVQYVSKGNIRNIKIEGNFESSMHLFPRSVVLTFYLLGTTNRDYVYLQKYGLLKLDGSFEETLEPVPRPLFPGRYSLNVAILPSNQDPLIRNLIKWSPDPSWGVILQVGTNEEIEDRYKKEIIFIKDVISRIKDKDKEIKEKAQNFSKPWFSEWLMDLKKLENQVKIHNEESLIPLFTKTEAQILILVEKLTVWGGEMQLWLERRSLFPPSPLSDGSFAIYISKAELNFEIEKNMLKR